MFEKFVLKIDGGFSSSILMALDCDIWNNTHMSHDIFEFWSK